MLKNTKTNESGRSMVEMLGVLAVIGVLSVAGIAGYTTAMRSYRTNEVLNAASMLYVMAKAQNMGNGATGNLTYASLNNGTNPSGVSSITYTDGSISINFNTKEDCDAAKLKLGDKAGTCPATATEGAYALTVTLGDATSGEQGGGTPSGQEESWDCEGIDAVDGGKKGDKVCTEFNNGKYFYVTCTYHEDTDDYGWNPDFSSCYSDNACTTSIGGCMQEDD